MHAVAWGSFRSHLWVTTLCAFASVSISLHAVTLEYAHGHAQQEGRNRAPTARIGGGGARADARSVRPPSPPRSPRSCADGIARDCVLHRAGAAPRPPPARRGRGAAPSPRRAT